VQSEQLHGAVLDVNLRGRASTPIAEALQIRGVPFVVASGYGQGKLESPVLDAAPRLSKPFDSAEFERALGATFIR
jgi:hypothetical protein